ncbi:FtsW/RodA/SpoVE family cell cycle protein [Ligilactobacillus sp.]|uniref:FtsW/RodA/SpoVE family cell cycle protein n=1 Tax=Ligilactobacillus sp. TaxID=2767921 RepID=UPI002FE2ACDD
MVYSASSTNLAYANASTTSYFTRQVIFDFVGLLIMFGISAFNSKGLNKFWTNSLKFLTIFLLIFVLFFTAPVNGARAWISLGAVSVQPSEVCKIMMVLWLSRELNKRHDNKKKGKEFYLSSVIVTLLVIGVLIIFEPDFGGLCINSSIVIVLFAVSVLCSRKNGKIGNVLFFGSSSLVVMLGLFLLKSDSIVSWMKENFHSYTIQRFIGYQDPFTHVATSGKQLVNSYIAISNGGIFGLGIGNGIQKRGYLPEPYTDFVLSVTAEELGFIGVLIILVALATLIIRIIVIGAKSNVLYDRLICYGTATLFFTQSFLNIGAVCGLVPITGVTLPFVSYGGSSVWILSACLGFVLMISSRQKDQRRQRDLEVM